VVRIKVNFYAGEINGHFGQEMVFNLANDGAA
jgi:hypothetical protein